MKPAAGIINDVTGLKGDPEMAAVVAESGAGLVIMHAQGNPRTMQESPSYDDVVVEVREFFQQQVQHAVDAGIEPEAIALDPGIGFGKTDEHNMELLTQLPRLLIDPHPLDGGCIQKVLYRSIVESKRSWRPIRSQRFTHRAHPFPGCPDSPRPRSSPLISTRL